MLLLRPEISEGERRERRGKERSIMERGRRGEGWSVRGMEEGKEGGGECKRGERDGGECKRGERGEGMKL